MRHRGMINGVAFPRAWIASLRERRDIPRISHGKRDSQIVIFFIVDIIRFYIDIIISASENLRDGAVGTPTTR